MKLADFTMPDLAAQLTPSSSTDKDRRVTPMLQQWFVEFADFASFHRLALHCGLCREDIAHPKRAWAHWGECGGFKPSPGDTGGSTLIKTASGSIFLGLRPERIELRAAQVEWLRQATDVLSHFKLGLHCQRCEADVMGKNSDTDAVYSAACRCSEFIGPNRDYLGASQRVN